MAFIAAAEPHVHVYLPENSAQDGARQRLRGWVFVSHHVADGGEEIAPLLL